MKRSVVIILLIVALLFVAAGIGAVVFFTSGRANFDFNANLVSVQAEESKTLNVDGPFTLKVQDDEGDVTIVGGEYEKMTIKAVKTGYGNTQAQAEEALKNITYQVDQAGDIITLAFELPKINTNVTQQVDFILTVPAEVTIDVQAGLGEVNVSGTQGKATITNSFGDIVVENLSGSLQVDTSSGRVEATSINAGNADIELSSGFGSVFMEKASGAKITAKSNSGTIDLENVRATQGVNLNSDFGNIKFDNGSAGTLSIVTKSGTVDLTSVKVTGLLQVMNDFGDINLEKVQAKPYDMNTQSGSIIVDGATGAIKAHTGFGNVTVKNTENATLDLDTESGSIDFQGALGDGPHTLHSNFGEIGLSIPADSALNVEFETEFGRVRSDIPVTVTLSGDLSEARQIGTMNGGGSELKVTTQSGNITINILSR